MENIWAWLALAAVDAQKLIEEGVDPDWLVHPLWCGEDYAGLSSPLARVESGYTERYFSLKDIIKFAKERQNG